LGTASMVDGSATLDAIFAKSGIHEITAQYGGDSVFLASSNSVPVQVAGFATTATLLAPANATTGASVTLTATISSSGGIPTGQVVFLDGGTNLGASALDGAGVAILRINTLAAGMHTLTASYAGDTKFDGSDSAGVTINIASADFSFGATPTTATVIAGDSTQFMLTVTPVGVFADSVTFSCSPVTGINCTFSPATVNSANGTASTTLTVTTSTSVTRYGFLMPAVIGPCALFIALNLLVLAMLRGGKLRIARASALTTVTASLAIVALVLAMGGCGGYGGRSQPNRGTASILVIARSGSVAHTTTVTVTVQ
jgi:Big-like domain-containing protein